MTVIHQIGSISITILMDNSTDFLLTNPFSCNQTIIDKG